MKRSSDALRQLPLRGVAVAAVLTGPRVSSNSGLGMRFQVLKTARVAKSMSSWQGRQLPCLAASKITATIPIVQAGGGDLVRSSLVVESLARPPNVTSSPIKART
jgi:hypothetical protein